MKSYLKILPLTDRQILVVLLIASFLLRVGLWDKFPPGFTADEATMGYDAYSLLKTGKDQFGTPWPLSFRSFGDYRPPLYIWTASLPIALFGLTPLAVRLPSMFAGSIVILLVYLLGRELFSKWTGFWAAVFLMLSPWSLLHTRFAQEANLSTLMITAGVTLLVYWMKKNNLAYLLSSGMFFSLSLYAYHNARLTAVLFVLGAAGVLAKAGQLGGKNRKKIIIAVLFSAMAVLPLAVSLLRFPEAVWRRASAQSVIGNEGILAQLYHEIAQEGPGRNLFYVRLRHNKVLSYGRAIASGYLSHFSPSFLFFSGDPHERFQTPGSGLLNAALIIVVPFGIAPFLAGDRRRRLILWWLVVAPVVAALSTIVPNSQHAQDMMIPLHLIAGVGAVNIAQKLKTFSTLRSAGIWLFSGIFLLSLWRFTNGYVKIVPYNSKYLQNWHYYGQVFEKLDALKPAKVIFLGGQFYINLAFHQRYDPSRFQQEVVVQRPENLSDFDHVASFGRYEFRRSSEIPSQLSPDTIYVRLSESGDLLPAGATLLERVIWPDGKKVYWIFTQGEPL